MPDFCRVQGNNGLEICLFQITEPRYYRHSLTLDLLAQAALEHPRFIGRFARGLLPNIPRIVVNEVRGNVTAESDIHPARRGPGLQTLGLPDAQ